MSRIILRLLPFHLLETQSVNSDLDPKGKQAGEARLRVSVFGESAENPAPPGTVTYAF